MSTQITTNMNTITKQDVTNRLKDLNKETPMIYTTSFIKEPQEITLRTVARNNLILDDVIANQKTIIENQNKILTKLGENVDTYV